MVTRLKFVCGYIYKGVSWDQSPIYQVGMHAVYDGSDDNKAFFKATPSGSITFHTVNEAAVQQFKEGQTYYVDIVLADTDPAKVEGHLTPDKSDA